MKKALDLLTLCALLGAASAARATPSTMVWAPSTAAFQGFLVPHITYDTYFEPQAASPIDTGLTMGVLPFDTVNAEVGFDLFFPTGQNTLDSVLQLNGKIGTPEGTLAPWAPGLSVGFYGVGFKSDFNDYDILYGVVGKTFAFGYLAAGAYTGLGPDVLFTAPGATSASKTGFIGGYTAPDLTVGAPWLKKVVFAADVQTGDNALGAVGVGASFFFTDTVSLLTGPVFFLKKEAQPNATPMMWTVQLDVDLPLKKS